MMKKFASLMLVGAFAAVSLAFAAPKKKPVNKPTKKMVMRKTGRTAMKTGKTAMKTGKKAVKKTR